MAAARAIDANFCPDESTLRAIDKAFDWREHTKIRIEDWRTRTREIAKRKRGRHRNPHSKNANKDRVANVLFANVMSLDPAAINYRANLEGYQF